MFVILFFNRGADLAALVREASICALRTVMKNLCKGGQPVIVNKSHFEEAFLRVKPSVQAKVKTFKCLIDYFDKLQKLFMHILSKLYI